MVDERDLSEQKKWLYKERAKITITNLEKKHISAQYILNCIEALSVVLKMIPKGVTVACEDSVTVALIGVTDALRKRNQNNIFHPMERDAEISSSGIGISILPCIGRPSHLMCI